MAQAAQGQLVNPGDVLTLTLGNTGVGNPFDQSAVISFSGTFTNATIAVEALPLSQPMLQGTTGGGPQSTPTPTNLNEWAPIQEVGVLDGIPVSSPLTLTSTGLVGSAIGFVFGCALFQQLRLRLISGTGTIQAGIATNPFPAPPNLTGQSASLLLELQRIRLGISGLVETDLKEAIPVLGIA